MDTGGGSGGAATDAADGDAARASSRAAATAEFVEGPSAPREGRFGRDGRVHSFVRTRLGGYHRVAGAALLLAWGTWFVLTTIVQPRMVDEQQLTSDLQAGAVTSWRVVAVDDDGSRSWSESLRLNLPSTDASGDRDDTGDVPGSTAIWYTTDALVAGSRIVEPAASPPVEVLAARLREAGVPPSTGGPMLTPDRAPERPQLAGLLTGFLFISVLLLGPRPTRGTRWFWFWFGFASMGAGVVAYAVGEHLRPRPDPDPPTGRALDVLDRDEWPERTTPVDGSAATDDDPVDGPLAAALRADPQTDEGHRRRSGLAGFGFAILLSFLVSGTLSVLGEGADLFWLPRP